MSIVWPFTNMLFILLFAYQPELNRFQEYKQKKTNAIMEIKDVSNVGLES